MRNARLHALAPLAVACALGLAMLGGCARVAARPDAARSDGAAAPHSGHDPLERLNRGVFWANDKLDQYVLEPVATGYDRISPDPVKRSVSNFFLNLRSAVIAANDLLQGKVKEAGSDVARFAVNSTVGVAGFFDPATDLGLQRRNEDFGQTLGYHGVGTGPYLVLPIFGPSTLRDGVAVLVDNVLAVYPLFTPSIALWSARVVDTVNARALALTTVDEAKRASLDFYVAVRTAYLNRRRTLVEDGSALSPEEEENLYYFDDRGSQP